MQKYENNLKLLSEFLDFLKYKLDNNKLTLSEIDGLKKAFTENINLTGTAEDIAIFYHKQPQDVRNVVHRKMLSRPERKVYYSFNEFQKVVPDKWNE